MSSKINAGEKFKALLEALSGVGVDEYPDTGNDSGQIGASFAESLAKDTSGMLSDKIKKGNQAASVVMPPAPIEQWLVQVYPDDAGMLHFQAKSQEGIEPYVRQYIHVSDDVYAEVKAAYDLSNKRRKSFYSDSSKPYMPCTRSGQDEVNIPGYGIITVEALFPSN